jgi:hypothetical protein
MFCRSSCTAMCVSLGPNSVNDDCKYQIDVECGASQTGYRRATELRDSRFSVADLCVVQRKISTIELGRYREPFPSPGLRVHAYVSVSWSFPCWSRGGTCREGMANLRQSVGRSSPSTRANTLFEGQEEGQSLLGSPTLTLNIQRVVMYNETKARQISRGNIPHVPCNQW